MNANEGAPYAVAVLGLGLAATVVLGFLAGCLSVWRDRRRARYLTARQRRARMDP